MSIASELQRIEKAKSDLKTVLESKGLSLPSNYTLDQYPSLVNLLPN